MTIDRPPIPDPPHRGGCLCGAVRYAVNARPLSVVACHCRDCQKLSGATNVLTVYVATEAFVHEQGEVESYRKRADSGREADYVRCAKCGVRVWHKPLTLPQLTMVAAGTLDDQSWVVPVAHIWTSRAAPSAHVPEGVATWEMHPADRLEAIKLFEKIYPQEHALGVMEHCPMAEEETHLLLIEPTGTPSTGDATTAAARRVI